MPRCADCGIERERLQKHHVIPKSLGGSNSHTNLVRICANCHEDRHATEEGRKPWANAQTPEAQAKRAATMREKWKDPEFRAKHAEGIKRSWEDPDVNARRRAGLKAGWADESQAEKWAERNKKVAATKSALGQGNLENLKKGWIPEVHAKAIEASAVKRRGTTVSDETKRKTSESLKRAYAEGRRKRGHSQATRDKISATKRGTN